MYINYALSNVYVPQAATEKLKTPSIILVNIGFTVTGGFSILILSCSSDWNIALDIPTRPIITLIIPNIIIYKYLR